MIVSWIMEGINTTFTPGTLVLALSTSLALGSYIFSRFVAFCCPEEAERKVPIDVLMSILNIAYSGFFILIIFIILNVWNYLQLTNKVCVNEASTLANLIENARYFTPQSPVVKAAEDYVEAIRTDEWRSMKKGKESPVASQAWQNLFLAIKNFQPPSTGNNSVYLSQLLTTFNAAQIARGERLSALRSVLPTQLRRAVFLGSFIFAVFLGALWRTKSLVKLLPVLVFDLILGFSIALAMSMDYPFSGQRGKTEGMTISKKIYYSGILREIPSASSPDED